MSNAVTNVTGTFDGIDDYVVADITSAPVLDQITIHLKLGLIEKPNYLEEFLINQVNLFVHTNNNPTYSENSLVLSITTAGGSHVINTGLNQNKWHHIAFTVSAANVYTII
jgi:hypothetical protein